MVSITSSRLHFGQDLGERGVAVKSDVFVDIFGVDHAAVAQHHALLLFVELDLVQLFDMAGLLNRPGEQQALNDAALDQVLFYDLVYIRGLDAAVKRAFGVHDDHRPGLAQAEAAGLHQLDFLLKAVLGDLFVKLL